MNDLIFLQHLFDGYVTCFGRNRWHYWMEYADATAEEIGHFRNLGLMLGYIPVREWRGYPLVEPPRDLVWLQQGQHYPNHRNPRLSPVILHLERENVDTNCLPCIDNPSNKLLYAACLRDGRYLVAVFGWVTPITWQTCVQFIQNNPDYKDAKVLMIGCIGPNANSVRDIEAMVWVNHRAYCRKAKFEMDLGGFWYAHFDNHNWVP